MFTPFGYVDNWPYIQQLKHRPNHYKACCSEKRYFNRSIRQLMTKVSKQFPLEVNVWVYTWQSSKASFCLQSIGLNLLAASKLLILRVTMYSHTKCIDKQNRSCLVPVSTTIVHAGIPV